MNNATEELRALLDKCGVRWYPMHGDEAGYYEDRDTEFVANGKKHTAHECGSGLAVYNLTPQQAIAATFGELPQRNTYYIKPDGETWKDTIISQFDDLMATSAEVCSVDELQEIDAYIFNQIAEEETCHETNVNRHWRGCSECGYKWEFMYGIGTCERPTYCPQCGRRVK